MSRFSPLGTSTHDPNDDNTPVNTTPSALSTSDDRHDPLLRHDVAQSFESMSFHSPSWSTGFLSSVSHPQALSPPIDFPHSTTLRESWGGPRATTGGSSGLGDYSYSLAPASPIEDSESALTDLFGQSLYEAPSQRNPFWGFLTDQDIPLPRPLSPALQLTPAMMWEENPPESLTDQPERLRRSSSVIRSERGAETWPQMAVASSPSKRSSPYPSPHTSPNPFISSLSDEHYRASSSSDLLRVESARSDYDLSEIPSSFATAPKRVHKSEVTTQKMAYASERRRRKEGKFVCSVCGNTLTSKTNLQLHTHSHFGVRPFECRVGCGKKFTHGAVRNRHERGHAEDKNRCDVCGKKFIDENTLKKHQNAGCLKLQDLSGWSVVGSEDEMSEDKEKDVKAETNVTKVEEGTDAIKVEVGGGMVVNKVEVDEDTAIPRVKEEEKEISTSAIPSVLFSSTKAESPDLQTDNTESLAMRGSLTPTRQLKNSNTSANRGPEDPTQTLTTSKLIAPAVGDRIPFTLRSQHMTRYVVTMSAEQQEALDIEMAQRRLRERNARKAAMALGVSQT